MSPQREQLDRNAKRKPGIGHPSVKRKHAYLMCCSNGQVQAICRAQRGSPSIEQQERTAMISVFNGNVMQVRRNQPAISIDGLIGVSQRQLARANLEA